MKSPLDEAILAAHPFDMAGWRKIDEVPFDFERRRVSVLVEHDAKRRLIVKGAPEDLLRLSGRYEDADGEERPLDAETRRTFEATLDALGARGIPRTGHRKPRGRCEPRDRRDHRRERPGLLRLRCFPRSSESKCRGDDPGNGGRGHLREGADRRQRARDPPRLRRNRRAGHRSAHRRRADASLGGGADRTVAAGQPVLSDQPAAEASDPAGAEAARPCRRLHGRRHQRCSGAARRGCRHLGRRRRRCRARGCRSDPARARPFGGARSCGPRAQHGPERVQVRPDGFEFKLRQYVQHGRRSVVPAFPADAADPDTC